MNLLERIHDKRVHTRRVVVLAKAAAGMLPVDVNTLLDIGCGDGVLAAELAGRRPGLRVEGVEVGLRAHTAIPVRPFDGRTLPYADGSMDATMLVDVLHHTTDPENLLREATRVARRSVLIKDHYVDGLGARATLSFMDDVSNRRHNVALPYHYLRRAQWEKLFRALDLELVQHDSLRQLYPFPGNLVFGRGLHFLALLRPSAR